MRTSSKKSFVIRSVEIRGSGLMARLYMRTSVTCTWPADGGGKAPLTGGVAGLASGWDPARAIRRVWRNREGGGDPDDRGNDQQLDKLEAVRRGPCHGQQSSKGNATGFRPKRWGSSRRFRSLISRF